MESLPSELISFIQQLRPLMRVEVFNSFCFLLMGILHLPRNSYTMVKPFKWTYADKPLTA